MCEFRAGIKVGIHKYENPNIIEFGPFILVERSENQYETHMWNVTNDLNSNYNKLAESIMFHWWCKNLKAGDPVPPPPPPGWYQWKEVLKEIPAAREGMCARKVWDTVINLPFLYGPGETHFGSYWPNVVDPERCTSRLHDAKKRVLRSVGLK